MIDRIITAIIVVMIKWYRDNRDRAEFRDIVNQYRALLDNLETANISDEEKNAILDKQVVSLLRSARKLRE